MWHGAAFDIVAVLHGKGAPSDAEWNYYCGLVADHNRQGSQRGLRAFAITIGGGPNAPQRQRIAAVTPKEGVGAVVSPSSFVRGIVTALNWIGNTGIRAFAPTAIDAALDYVGLTREEAPRFLADMRKLGEDIEGINPMAVIIDT